jgi:Zn-dependent protease
MNQRGIPLGKIFGIPIGLDYSWFVVFALLTWMLASSYYPEEFKQRPLFLYWLTGAITAIMLFVSVLLHEFGHSVIALHYKIPVRSITLFLFGGVAQIGTEPPEPGRRHNFSGDAPGIWIPAGKTSDRDPRRLIRFRANGEAGG